MNEIGFQRQDQQGRALPASAARNSGSSSKVGSPRPSRARASSGSDRPRAASRRMSSDPSGALALAARARRISRSGRAARTRAISRSRSSRPATAQAWSQAPLAAIWRRSRRSMHGVFSSSWRAGWPPRARMRSTIAAGASRQRANLRATSHKTVSSASAISLPAILRKDGFPRACAADARRTGR